MAPLFDTLCGVTTAGRFEHIYAIGSGLTPNLDYYLFFESLTPGVDSYTGFHVTTNANGNCFFSLSQGTEDIIYWIHSNNLPGTSANPNDIYRVGNSIHLVWDAIYDPTPTNYGTPAVLGPVIPGDRIVSVQWAAAIACDPRLSSLTYAVRRNITSPPVTTRVSGLTDTGWLDSGLANGTQEFYLVRTTFSYLDDLIVPVADGGGFYDSNILSATPFLLKEYWGVLGRPV